MLVPLLLGGALASASTPLTLAVRDRFGRPVEGVSACAIAESACAPLALAPTGSDLSTLASPGSRLRVSAPGFEAAEVAVPPAAAEELPSPSRLEVVLVASGSIEGRLLSFDERRALVLSLSLHPVDAVGKERAWSVETLELPPRPRERPFRVGDVPDGAYALVWEGPDVARGEKPVTVSAGRASRLGPLGVSRGARVPGSVRDEFGGAVAGATVSLSADAVFEESVGPVLRATSAADGTFSLLGVPLGEKLRWVARRDGFGTGRGLWGGETRLEIVLERQQTIVGRVRGPSGEPLAGATVGATYLRTPDTFEGGETTEADEYGRFTLLRAEPFRVSLTIEAPGLRPLYRELPERAAGAPSSIDLGDLSLPRGRTLRGHAREKASGEPLPGVEVVVERRDPYTVAGFHTSEAATALTDAEGGYEVSGLPERVALSLTARKEGFARQVRSSRPEQDEYDFSLSRGGRVEGTVCGPPWEIAAATIWIEGTSDRRSPVDASGRFTIDRLEPGSIRLTRAWTFQDPLRPGSVHMSSGFAETLVRVEEGSTVVSRIGCDGIPVSGVATSDGRPLASYIGSAALASGTENAPYRLDFLTDDRGAFAFRVPSAGELAFAFRSPTTGTQVSSPDLACQVPPGGTDSCRLEARNPR